MTITQKSEVPLHPFVRRVFGCSAEVADAIVRRARDRRYSVKTVIIKQGDRPDTTFLLVSGRAHALTYGLDGKLVLLHEFLPGDFFGAITNLDNTAQEMDVVAVENARAAVFLVLEFLNLVETHGCVAVVLSRALLRQLQAAALRMREQTTLSANGRVYAELLRQARLGHERMITPAPVLSELAVRVHSTRETVSRAIGALERRGIVRRQRGALIIVAPHRLEELII